MHTQRNSRSLRRYFKNMQSVFIAAISAALRNKRSKPPLRRAVLMLGLLLIVSGCVAAIWSRREAPAAAQTRGDTARLTDEAARQIRSLLDEKRSRTPAQQKIDSQLLYAGRMRRGQEIAPGVGSLQIKVEADRDDRVVVDITAVFNRTLIEDLAARGAEIIGAYQQYHSVRASVQFDQLEATASLPAVRFIQPKQEADYLRRPAPEDAAARQAGLWSRAARVRGFMDDALASLVSGDTRDVQTGSKTSEGDKTHRAEAARAMFGFNGAGVRIGVISDGVANLATSQALGDLAPGVVVLPGQNGSGDEGTAMLEIIHDLAPGAQLYFASALGGVASFAKNIRDLRAAGCDIIVDDVLYFVESPFHDGQTSSVMSMTNGGLITQAVNDVVASGAFYFSSAGNSGNKNDNTSGTWEGNFTDGGTLPIIPGGALNNFSGAQSSRITAIGGPIGLFWSDPLGGSNNDYDLFVLNSSLSAVVASSTNAQNGSQDPFEQITSGIAVNNHLVILKKDGAANRFLHLSSNGGRLSVNTQGATRGHSSAANAYSVAATPAGPPFGAAPNPTGPFPNPFNANNKVELFSSDGPRRIFFNPAGAPITPGNFSSTGGLLRQKPDITAADGVMVTGAGGFPTRFFGTSAAAPHAAAIAALLKSANQAATQTQIRAALTNTALDIETADVDRDAGAGIVRAFEALQSIGAAPSPNLELGPFAAAELSGNGNKLIEPGESGALVVKLLNTGVVNASNINATLTSTTPGVAVTQGSSAYGDVPAPDGMAANATPFTFALNSNAACPQRVEFTLSLTFNGGGSPRVLPFSVETGPPPTVITSTLDSTTPASGPGFTGVSGLQMGRLNRTGDFSSCGISKTCPGALPNSPAPRRYDAYTFTSCPVSASACVTVTLNTVCGGNSPLFAAAYAGSFNPNDLCENYLADSGVSPPSGGSSTFSFNVPSGSTFTIVVNEVNSGMSAGCNYTLNIGGLCCQLTNACPAFSSFSPAGAGPGSTVMINGSNFTGVTGVRFANNLAAGFNVVSDTQIAAIVPAGAVTGPVTISKPGCPDLFTGPFKGDCAYTIAPASQTFTANRGTGNVNVMTTGDCGWNAVSNDGFITLDPTSGSGVGNGTVNFTVAPTTATAPRSGTITVAGRTFIVFQFGTSGIPPATWVTQNSNTTNQLNSVHFTSDNRGWAAGLNTTLRHTIDGGANWTTVNTAAAPANGFHTVRFINQNIGWAGGVMSLLFTTNGGGGFTPTTLPFSSPTTTHTPTSYFPISDTRIWGAGSGSITTPNGVISGGALFRYGVDASGATTDVLTNLTQNGPIYQDIFFVNSTTGGAVGDQGRIVRITNAEGIPPNFPVITTQTSGTTQALNSIHMLDTAAAWVVGDGGTILKTTNGGVTWTPQPSGVTTNLRDVHFADANRGWAVGDGGLILGTIDGGNFWYPEASRVTSNLRSVHFATADAGYAVGANGVILKRLNCSYSISPMSANVASGGGGGQVNVMASAGCNWKAVSNDAWITVFIGASGVGNGVVSFAVAANPVGAPRTGTIAIAGQTFTVTQAAAQIPCPMVSGVNPIGAPVGAMVTISGTNFNGVTSVKFANNVTAAIDSGNDTQLVVTVPNGAVTGPITISKTGCSDVQTAPFNVIQPIYEADVTPRPNGNGAVTIGDWVQVGRFATGLDTIDAGEFQRADCAPRESLGNGAVTISDWVQAGRYATGLDPLSLAGGPAAPNSPLGSASLRTPPAPNGSPINIDQNRLHRVTAFEIDSTGDLRRIAISLDARGAENALGFSLLFNPSEWRFVSASAGTDALGAKLHINSDESPFGRIGVAMALPAGRSFEAGSREIIILQFARQISSQFADSPFAIGFGDRPVSREVVSTDARPLLSDFTLASRAVREITTVSAASFIGDELAKGQIATAFGERLVAQAETATFLPLPVELGGAKVLVTDSAGVERPAPLFFTSPSQINFLVPVETALGTATITVLSSDGVVSVGVISVTEMAPGLFAANGDGQGPAAAVLLRIRSDGSRSIEPVVDYDTSQNEFVAAPIDLGAPDDQVFLICFGTGLSALSSDRKQLGTLSDLKATVEGTQVEVSYAGPQGEFLGLDQINLRLPRALAGSGEVGLSITVNGVRSNVISVRFK